MQKGIKFKSLKRLKIKGENIEHFSRFFPKISFNSGVTLITPFLPFNRLQVFDIMNIKNIKPHLEPCQYAEHRPKRELFKQLHELPTEEENKIYEIYTLDRLKEEFKNHTKNYEEGMVELKKQDYSSFLL